MISRLYDSRSGDLFVISDMTSGFTVTFMKVCTFISTVCVSYSLFILVLYAACLIDILLLLV